MKDSNMKKIFTNEELTHTIVFSWDDSKLIPETNLPGWVDFKCYKITGQRGNETPLYGMHFEETYNPDHEFCNGFIKWDGCMEIHDLTMHLCGWSRHIEFMIRDIYLNAATIMQRYDLEEYGNLKECEAHYGIKSEEQQRPPDSGTGIADA